MATKEKLKKELDKIYSVYIRLTYADSNGIVKCFTCSNRGHWQTMQNGHYVSRQYTATRWQDKNCHVQCIACNIFKHGNMEEYALAMVKKYGSRILATLNNKKHEVVILSTTDYEREIKKYKRKVATLLAKIGNPNNEVKI